MIEITATNLPYAMNCPGWLGMPSVLPGDDDPTARDEGNAAHWVANELFHGRHVVSDAKAPNGFIVSDQMIAYVNEYLSALDCGGTEIITTFGNERWRVNARADHIKYDNHTLVIDDFKYGWRPVNVEQNWTLIAHAVGHSINCGVWPAFVKFRIHQPRAYHPEGPLREWSITGEQLATYYHQIDATLSAPTNELRTWSGCAKCHAAPNCPAYRMSAMNAIDVKTIAFSDNLSPEALSFELDTIRYAKEVLDGRLKAIEELATYQLKQGKIIPEYAVESRYGDRQFKPGIDAAFLRALIGIDCAKTGLVTVAEVERRAKGNEPALAAIKQLTTRPMIGTKLVRISADKRARKLLKLKS